MLTLSKPLTAGQAQTYHKKEFISKEQSYWARGQEIQGEWQGRLAEKYGLSGAVGADEFARLSQGQHPVTGEQLIRHRAAHTYEKADGTAGTTSEHRAGWDATFSAPKSVSLTALVGGDVRVREAHRESVRVALDELERYTQARMGGNHPAETTGKVIAAKFEHDTARPVEGYAAPQLHTHAVIFNLTELDNGQPRALQPHSLFASQQFATAVYQSELTYRLVQFGYELERGRSGAPEIKGYTQEYLDASSPRSQQIKTHLEKLGLSSKESAEIAAHSTRDRKQILSPAEVLAAHRQLAEEFGNQPDRVVAQARERAQEIREAAPAVSSVRAQEAVTFSRDRNFEREAVVDERLLMRDALRRGMGKVTYSEVQKTLRIRIDQGDFVSRGQKGGGHFYTTPEMIAAERAVINQMRAGLAQMGPILERGKSLATERDHSHLTTAQADAIQHVLMSRDRILGIQGVAGAGKTRTLNIISTTSQQSGYEVEGIAPTSRAAKQLREAGIPAETLQAFLVRGQGSENDGHRRRLYLVDESSLASTAQMQQLLNRLGARDRVVLVGDIRQHQAVEAGRPFEQLQEAGMSTARLDQIIRQKDPDLKAAVEHLARGNVAAGITALRVQGRITQIGSPIERMRAIAKDYAESPGNTLVVSPDNTSRRQLNEAIRAELQSKGIISNENHVLEVLAQQQDTTGADRRWAARYATDDFLRYSRGSKVLGIKRGSYARVISTNLHENLLTVQLSSGNALTYDPRRLAGVSIYRESERAFAKGDRLQFTAPDKTIGVANRELGTIEHISPERHLSVRLENGRIVSLNATENRHFDYGYAVTSHSAQGTTSDRVLINVDTGAPSGLLNSRFAYVSVSRGKNDVRIYTNDSTVLESSLSHDSSKSSAIVAQTGLEQAASHGFSLTL